MGGKPPTVRNNRADNACVRLELLTRKYSPAAKTSAGLKIKESILATSLTITTFYLKRRVPHTRDSRKLFEKFNYADGIHPGAVHRDLHGYSRHGRRLRRVDHAVGVHLAPEQPD